MCNFRVVFTHTKETQTTIESVQLDAVVERCLMIWLLFKEESQNFNIDRQAYFFDVSTISFSLQYIHFPE